MKSFYSFAALIVPALATDWHYLWLGTPSGANITSFSGTMEIPTTFPSGYPGSGGTYYLWPGLQGPTGGVLQNVLGPNKDGSTWGIFSGFCCNVDFPWGGGIATMNGGQEVWFNNYRNSDGSWTSQTALSGQPVAASNTFPLSGSIFNGAYFAIELYEPAAWNFGPYAFTNVDISWVGSDTSNCAQSGINQSGSFDWSASGFSSSVSNGYVHCHIDSVTLQKPT